MRAVRTGHVIMIFHLFRDAEGGWLLGGWMSCIPENPTGDLVELLPELALVLCAPLEEDPVLTGTPLVRRSKGPARLNVRNDRDTPVEVHSINPDELLGTLEPFELGKYTVTPSSDRLEIACADPTTGPTETVTIEIAG